MKCTLLHESRGRLRVHVCNVRMTLHRADVLEAYLNHHDAVSKAKVYERTGDVVVYYTGSRKDAVAALSTYRFDDPELDALVTSADSRRINQEYQEKMYNLLAGRVLRELFLPAPLNAAYTVFRSIKFLWKGVCCLWRRKLEVEVLDALSIGVSILRGDFATAGSVMFLLNVGSLLEEWTRKKSLDDLARSMALNVDKVWVRAQGTEVLMPLTKVHPGDEIVVRSGNMIPLDGTVIEGEAMVNQAALTGKSMPVRKTIGATVYAGTVGRGRVRPDHQDRGRRKPLRQDRGHDRGIREAEVQHRKPCAGSGRSSGSLVPRCYRRHLRPDPERHPRHLLPDGRFLLRPQALHAAGRSFCHARVRRKPYHRQGRQVPRDPVQG